jgi:hypothetical protein
MPSRGLPTVPASRFLCREDLVPGPANEPTGSLCKIAWLGKSRLEREEQWRQLRNDKFRALKDARRSRSREEPARRAEAETGTTTHSFASVWRAEFADLEIVLTGLSQSAGRSHGSVRHQRTSTEALRAPGAWSFSAGIRSSFETRRSGLESASRGTRPPGEIILEWWATSSRNRWAASSRNDGRLQPESADSDV